MVVVWDFVEKNFKLRLGLFRGCCDRLIMFVMGIGREEMVYVLLVFFGYLGFL